ncbi:MAG: type I-E CRISPR-associated protein Cse2/CasB [Nitrospirae bacterium]|nr:type I-E CRISPR-associated protein Cse2/CasB [Nitrospirota bacterium]
MSRLLEELRKYKARDDRGIMANLRCILVDSKKHRAWPALNRLGIKVDDYISAFIAGLYATHPKESSIGNFGTTCKAIQSERNESASKKDNNLTPTERRFQHLLAARGWDELSARVYRMVLMAKAQDVRVNYVQLGADLTDWVKDWGDITRTEWAAKFWTIGTTPVDEEDL